MENYEIKEEDGNWYITIATGPDGAKSGMCYKKQEGETIGDIEARIDSIIRDYQNIGKYAG
jgi:hypothetical protein